MITRREAILGAAAAAAASAAARVNSVVSGVALGAQSYSFRDRDLDGALAAMKEIGIGYCELFSGHVEPRFNFREEGAREKAKAWRLSQEALDKSAEVKKKFDAAGIELHAFNYSFREDFTDAEIERGFEMGKIMGVKKLTASSNVSTAKRVDPFAKKYKIFAGMHNHSRIVANEFATPEDFTAAMNGMSKYIAVNLDIGHFWAANFNPVEYLKQNHERIVTLHIKDRRKNQGPNVVFGEGDTPIKAVLQELKANKWKIPAMIEYEYKGEDTVAEVRKCFNYMKQALA
ncbi:MAG: sugar phosphate isomerase/epimerase [Acidobacteria bacterium]|nr:sugar phosphate isomerase/epimerase [Acidobacteriota bacterium]